MMNQAVQCTTTEQQHRAISDYLAPVEPMTADELKNELELLQITQSQFSTMLEVSEKTVSFWTTGKSPVPAYIALLLRLMRENIALKHELEDAKQRVLEHFFDKKRGSTK